MGAPQDPASPAREHVEMERFAEAQDGYAQEHDMTLLQALKLYPKAVFWSLVMSTAVIMEGYDTKLIGTLFAQPVFQRTYGQPAGAGSYQISAAWQTGLSNGSAGGQLLGLLLGGFLSERFRIPQDDNWRPDRYHWANFHDLLCP